MDPSGSLVSFAEVEKAAAQHRIHVGLGADCELAARWMALQPRSGVRVAGAVGGDGDQADSGASVLLERVRASVGADGGERSDGGRSADLAGVSDDVRGLRSRGGVLQGGVFEVRNVVAGSVCWNKESGEREPR